MQKANVMPRVATKTKTKKKFETVAEGVDILGGAKLTSELCGVTIQAVTNWQSEGFFPANTWELLREEFDELGYRVDPKLWRMKTKGNVHKVHTSPKTGKPIRTGLGYEVKPAKATATSRKATASKTKKK
jgi:hypothetical protein